jgi:surfeit locus 1 family protein
MTLRGRDWALLAVAVMVAVLCGRLGLWQLDRLSQRRARNAVVAAARARPPLELAGAAVSVDSIRDRPVRARGVYDYAHERTWGGRPFDGTPGVAVLTPLRLPDGSAVFVDRGWVPSPDARHVDLRALREGDSVVVTGLGAPAPRGRGDVDPARLADSLPYAVQPFVIQLPPTDGATLLRRLPPRALDDGPHLAYAVQWFAFGTIALVGSLILLRASRR